MNLILIEYLIGSGRQWLVAWLSSESDNIHMSEDRGTTVTTGNTSLQHNNNMDVEFRAKKKPSKFDSLKPLLNLLETLLLQHGMTQHSADLVVLDIAERFVTAGYGWDKIIQYQSKGQFFHSFLQLRFNYLIMKVNICSARS